MQGRLTGKVSREDMYRQHRKNVKYKIIKKEQLLILRIYVQNQFELAYKISHVKKLKGM